MAPHADETSPLRSDPQSGGRTAQLRSAIDSGRTGDKVGVSDPAAAPLGTDEEAAGTPVPSAQAAAALEHETNAGIQLHADARGRVDPHRPREKHQRPYAMIMLLAVLLVAAAVFASTLWLRV
jgi:hypothetical protein